jgi:hypothetical protein
MEVKEVFSYILLFMNFPVVARGLPARVKVRAFSLFI